jgi:hypothetical protein
LNRLNDRIFRVRVNEDVDANAPAYNNFDAAAADEDAL